MEVAKITAKGQISLPRSIREAAHLAPGDRVGFEMRGQEIVLVPLRARSLSDLRGAWRTDRPLPDLPTLRARRAAELAQADRESSSGG